MSVNLENDELVVEAEPQVEVKRLPLREATRCQLH